MAEPQLGYGHTSLAQRTTKELESGAGDFISYCEYEAISAGCGSPIEIAFLHALLVTLRFNFGRAFLMEPCSGTDTQTIFIEPQKQLGDYRVDFLLTVVGGPKIVIECDGHDFHERTADQAERDRKRDRSLQADDYKVFRFTGREIFRSAVECVLEVHHFITASFQ